MRMAKSHHEIRATGASQAGHHLKQAVKFRAACYPGIPRDNLLPLLLSLDQLKSSNQGIAAKSSQATSSLIKLVSIDRHCDPEAGNEL